MPVRPAWLLLLYFVVLLSTPLLTVAQSEYTLSPLTVSALNVAIGTTIEFSARISPLPQIPKDCDFQPAGYCMHITLEIQESESKDWKPVLTISILNDLPLGGMGHYSPDGSFLMGWTPDSIGKFMARVKLVSYTALSGDNVLAVSPPIGWIEVGPIYFVGLIPFSTVQSWQEFIGASAVLMLMLPSLIYVWYRYRKSGSEPFVEMLSRPKPTAAKEYEEVGGLAEVKAALTEAIELPLHRPELFEKYRVVPPTKGLLLYGPPGCGKTLLARSIASKGKIAFIYSRSTDIFTKYYGESASRVRDLFNQARQQSPCVLFFDEIDALVPFRGMADEGTEREDVRVTSEFLAQMDGLSPLERVIVLGATNRPEAIDPAILRPGRFDKILYVPPPDMEARMTILTKNMEGVPASEEVNLHGIAVRTEGYSGADIVALCREAKMSAMRAEAGGAARVVSRADFVRAFDMAGPSIDRSVIARYELFANNFRKSEST